MIAVVKHEIPSRFSIFIVNAPMRKSVKLQMVNPNNWLAGQINCLVSVRSATLGWNGLNTIKDWKHSGIKLSILVKVFKNGPSKICGRQHIKKFT